MALLGLALLPAAANAATIVVNEEEDTNGFGYDGCGLRDAVTAANNNAPFGQCPGDTAGADTIVLQGGVDYALFNFGAVDDTNAAGDLDITGPLTITTSGGLATVTGNGISNPTVAQRDRVIQIFNTAGGVTLQNLRVRQGHVQQAGAVGGGGILADAPLTISNSEIVDNRVQVSGATTQGGGIFVRGPLGTLTMTGSTVAGNVGQVAGGTGQVIGGGISVYQGAPFVNISNSTISGNSAVGVNAVGPGLVGGAFLGDYSSMANQIPATLINNTITLNTATAGGAVTGGLQVVNGTMTGNIVAGNTADNSPPDCYGGPTSSAGNILGINDGPSCNLTGPGDLQGSLATPVVANLGTLVNNGGLTRTHALNPGSPAINRGGTCPATDQRGFFRAPAAPCDAGSFEVGAPPSLPATPAAPGPTGQRAAALKKCKKKKSKKARKKCRRKALLLPV